MFIFHPDDASGNTAELRPGAVTICSADEILDILGNASYVNCTRVIFTLTLLPPVFSISVPGWLVKSFRNSRTTG
ncbi:MAG TPA: hypothetical protein DIS74_09075 [Bacteroidales bacterium]|nr:hypothetical protein [Bacteroidales bacterium]